jgi:CRP-like cAMP-binding protein
MHGRLGDPWRGLRGNLLLQSLNARDAILVASMVRPMECRAGEPLEIGAVPVPLVYFPETLVACLSAGERGIGIGVIGREGVIGWGSLTGTASDHRGRVELVGGSALVVAGERLRAAVTVSPTLALSLLGFVQTFTFQMGRTILSSRTDALTAQLSTWLLMFHDRVDGNEIVITHRSLAELLDLRRASVTDTLHMLEGERAIRCTRGRIVVRDRALLEALAGPAYGSAESVYRTAIGPFGKSSRADAAKPPSLRI